MSEFQYLYVNSYSNKIFIKEVKGSNRLLHISDQVDLSLFHTGKGEYKSIHGNTLREVKFSSIFDMRAFVKTESNISNSELCGMAKPEYQYIQKNHPDRSNFLPDPFNVLFFDIETSKDPVRGYGSPNDPFTEIILITAHFKNKDYVWATRDTVSDEAEVFVFEQEKDMLSSFFSFLKNYSIDIITGWNIDNFDIPYLVGRYHGFYGENSVEKTGKGYLTFQSPISPFGYIKRSTNRQEWGNDIVNYNIFGIQALDYIKLYKKFTYTTQESYSLNHISYVELGEKKVDYSEHKHLEDLFQNDYPKFVEYGIKDTQLVKRLDDKLQLITLAISVSYMAGCNVGDVFSPVKIWEVFLYNEMMTKNISIPFNKPHEESMSIVGAYVKPPLLGKHEWCVSYDLNSLYPHIFMFANMSPETYINKVPLSLISLITKCKNNIESSIEDIIEKKTDLSGLKSEGLSFSPNGALFSKTRQGIIPLIIKDLYKDRSETKKKMLSFQQKKENSKSDEYNSIIASLNARQMALKILLNSLYGASGNAHFILYNPAIAEGITSTGQVAIQWIAKKVNDYISLVLKKEDDRIKIIDTDSIYVNLGEVVALFKQKNPDLTPGQIADLINKFSEEKIQPVINSGYDELSEYMNSYEQSLKMKQEKICVSLISVAKKRYMAAVIDEEGVRYNEPKIKVTGLESVRSSTPEKCRKHLKELQKIMLLGTEEEAQKYILDFRKEFDSYSAQDIAIPKSVNDLEKWSFNGVPKKGAPQQVVASLKYNSLLKEFNIDESSIISGQKIKLIQLKQPNELRCTVLAFPGLIPEELNDIVSNSVDRTKQFDLTFLNPSSVMMNSIGWLSVKKVAVGLDSFF